MPDSLIFDIKRKYLYFVRLHYISHHESNIMVVMGVIYTACINIQLVTLIFAGASVSQTFLID